MPIVRTEKTGSYTLIDNSLLRNTEMSSKAKSALVHILSLPDDWIFSVNGLSTCLKMSRNIVQNILKELESLGYLNRQQNRDNSNKFSQTSFTFYESPQLNPHCTFFRHSENRCTENRCTENRSLLNTYNTNTNLTNDLIKKEKINKKEKSAFESSPSPSFSSPAVKDTDLNSDFEKLWAMYPNKQGKSKALARFKQAIKRGVNVTDIALGIKRYNDYIRIQGIEKQFVKHGDTWFGNSCWEDELDLTPPKPKVVTPPKPILYDDPMAGGRWV